MQIAVLGAGISGLACAYRLQQAGCSVRVYDLASEAGGTVGDPSAEVGTRLLLDDDARTAALARELGLATGATPFQAGAAGVLRDGRLSSFDPGTLTDIARYPGLTPAARARVLRYLLRASPKRRGLDFFDLSVGDDRLDTIDAYSATVEACGREVADYLVDPFVRALHFHSARQMSMEYFDTLAASFLTRGAYVARGLRDHARALPRALASRLAVVRANAPRVRASGGAVHVHDGGRHERFDAAVLAVPADVALAVLEAPTAQQERLLESTRYTSTLVCAYRVPRGIVGDVEGIWVPARESRVVCDAATAPGDDGASVLTLSLHDEAAAELSDRGDDEVLQIVAREWARLFPRYDGRLEGLRVQRRAGARPVYAVGHLTRVKHFWRDGQGARNVWLCGDYLNHPWVEGSIRCAEQVASRVAAAAPARRPLEPVG